MQLNQTISGVLYTVTFWDTITSMHIGVLGAAFNPPHLGHVLMAQQAVDFTDIDQVWLMPVNKHTFDKNMLSVFDRVAMTKLLVPVVSSCKTSLLETENHLDGNTINLVPLFKRLYPHDKFTFIIGSDNLPTFNKWGRWQDLLKALPFLVIPRAGYSCEPLYAGMRVLQHRLLITTNISSSIIRERVKNKLNISHLVPSKIEKYIKERGLYTS